MSWKGDGYHIISTSMLYDEPCFELSSRLTQLNFSKLYLHHNCVICVCQILSHIRGERTSKLLSKNKKSSDIHITHTNGINVYYNLQPKSSSD